MNNKIIFEQLKTDKAEAYARFILEQNGSDPSDMLVANKKNEALHEIWTRPNNIYIASQDGRIIASNQYKDVRVSEKNRVRELFYEGTLDRKSLQALEYGFETKIMTDKGPSPAKLKKVPFEESMKSDKEDEYIVNQAMTRRQIESIRKERLKLEGGK